jgi:hypothetical protein
LALALLDVASAQSKIAVGQRPITKVVTLLGEMKTQVEKDAKADLEAYDKYNCWCETNEKEKTEAIANAEQRISELSAFIEEAAARQGELKTDIEGLAADIAEDTEALQTATATRAKEHAEFLSTEADMKETRGLLGQSVEVLQGVQLAQTQGTGSNRAPGAAAARRKAAAQALIQVQKLVRRRTARKFQSMMQQDLFDVLGSLQEVAEEHGAGAAGTFLQQRRLLPWEKTEEQIGMGKKPNELKGAVQAKSYNSRSGRILGILDEMAAEFTRDLGAAQKADFAAEVSFQKLRAAKLAEIAAATEQKEMKETELADSMYKSAKAQENMESVQKSADADKKFLAELEKLCKSATEEYNTRVKERSEEIRALGEALAMLTEDEARYLFGKTMSFMQVASESARAAVSQAQRAALRERAAKRAMRRIAKVARNHRNWAMASLAGRIRLDAFTKVKAAMDKMLLELQTQQKEEYEKWEFCKKDIDKTEDSIWVATNTKTDLDNKHTELTNTIKTITTNTEMLKKEVAEMEVSLKKAGEERHDENAVFQQSMLDQRAMVNLLQKVMTRLEDFYSTNSTSFLQAHGGRYDPPPPPKPKGYTKSGTAGGVLQLLSMIITDAEVAEKDLAMGEQKAQEDYAAFVKVTTGSIEADRASIQEKTAQIASNSATLSETEEAQMANNAELSELKDMLHAHHLDCDYLLKYFDVRQTARAEEIDAIKDAKAILSGANFS